MKETIINLCEDCVHNVDGKCKEDYLMLPNKVTCVAFVKSWLSNVELAIKC
jgi:hypothetical protein